MPIEEGRSPTFGQDHLNSGNYLLGVIANRWISQLTYVYPVIERFEDDMRGLPRLLPTDDEPPVSDVPAWIFRNNDWRTRLIELKHYHPTRHRRSYSDDHPVHTEPPVPFNCVEGRRFSFAGITHVFLAGSPEYTPVESDELLPVVREYFYRV
jgi:hypothetical protein